MHHQPIPYISTSSSWRENNSTSSDHWSKRKIPHKPFPGFSRFRFPVDTPCPIRLATTSVWAISYPLLRSVAQISVAEFPNRWAAMVNLSAWASQLMVGPGSYSASVIEFRMAEWAETWRASWFALGGPGAAWLVAGGGLLERLAPWDWLSWPASLGWLLKIWRPCSWRHCSIAARWRSLRIWTSWTPASNWLKT